MIDLGLSLVLTNDSRTGALMNLPGSKFCRRRQEEVAAWGIFYPLSTVKTQLGPGLTRRAVLIKGCNFLRVSKSPQTKPHICAMTISQNGLLWKVKLDYLVWSHHFTDFSFQVQARCSKFGDKCSFKNRSFGLITYKNKNLKQYNWKLCMTLCASVVYLT